MDRKVRYVVSLDLVKNRQNTPEHWHGLAERNFGDIKKLGDEVRKGES